MVGCVSAVLCHGADGGEGPGAVVDLGSGAVEPDEVVAAVHDR